jgi:ATP-dependent Lhr-like helicase
MTNFDLLHPALQHHIVNSLGWRELRPFQDEVVPAVLSGQHVIVVAPTAGGKTEAALFPILSRMLSEGWSGLSVLYVCPIKALLNNLDIRLERYCTLLGRRSTLWHGDVGQPARRKIQKEPPDCLLTTPESLEVMLDSQSVDSVSLFSRLQAVIVDEIHAFAGDDRGWHLLSVLGRITKLAGKEIQRIGLSATVGNPADLLEWLAGSSRGDRRIFSPPAPKTSAADVRLDYVGSLSNAAIVISRLHRGEKRLVFIDTRSGAEQLAAQLRQLEVSTFVTHSSLGAEQRHQAEHAFANRENCVIVGTSVLELGIDVGDLDRVIQIDAPSRVSSFLQRMGRTGRRPDTTRNCLFLATDDESLIQAAGIVDLWSKGYVEPVVPPPLPYHVFAQQVMGLVLQQRGIARDEFWGWLEGCRGFAGMARNRRDSIVNWMVEQQILFGDGGLLAFGPKGEEIFGWKNFLELFSVFLSPPLFTILHGRQELGFVDELTFLGKKDGPRVLLLGGRSWVVKHVDWARKVAHVEPTDAKGQSRWKGEGQGLRFALCQAIRDVLATDATRPCWSHRAVERISEVRHDYSWLTPDDTVLLPGKDGDPEWWTFGGLAANAMLAGALSRQLSSEVDYDNFALTFKGPVGLEQIEVAIRSLRELDPETMRPTIDPAAGDGLKFSECVPTELITEMLSERLTDVAGARFVLAQPCRVRIASPWPG